LGKRHGGGAVPFLGGAVRVLRAWLDAADIDSGPVLRAVNKGGRAGGGALSAGKVPGILKRLAGCAGLDASGGSDHFCRVSYTILPYCHITIWRW
jgi:hypothetical protein